LRADSFQQLIVFLLLGDESGELATEMGLAGHLERDDLVELSPQVHLDLVGFASSRLRDRGDLPVHSLGAAAEHDGQYR